jgi:nicotinamidase-related amidase
MTSFSDRPNPALLVIDVQQGVVADAHERDQVIANITTLLEKARAEAVPVVWVQHSAEDLPAGSPEWQYVPELTRLESEPLVAKEYGDSFEATDLEAVLAGLGVGRLVVTGAQTDACIRSTLFGAVVRGYDAMLVTDAHTTSDLSAHGVPPAGQVIAHLNLTWPWSGAPDREATAAPTAAVAFRP